MEVGIYVDQQISWSKARVITIQLRRLQVGYKKKLNKNPLVSL